jgi:NADPH2:quinone reductase
LTDGEPEGRPDRLSLCENVGKEVSEDAVLVIQEKEDNVRAMRASGFRGYEYLELTDLPKPEPSDGKVLVRMTAAGVTPLDHTILSGQYHGAKAPLVLGNEGAGVVEAGGGPEFPAGSRVMFTGPYGVAEDGT